MTSSMPSNPSAGDLPEGGSPVQRQVQWRPVERTLPDYVEALWLGKLWIVLVALVSTVAAALFAFSKPNTYVADAMLMVHGAAMANSPAESALNLIRSGNLSQSQVQAASQIVQSRAVLEAVVRKIGAEEITKPYEPQEVQSDSVNPLTFLIRLIHGFQSWWFSGSAGGDLASISPEARQRLASKVLGFSLQVFSEDRSAMLTLQYRATDPELAQRILQAVVEESILHYQRLTAPEASRRFVQEKLKEAEAERKAAELEEHEFIRANGILDFGPDIERLRKEVSEAQAETFKNRMRLDQARQVAEELRREILKIPATEASEVEIQNLRDPRLDSFLSQLAALEVQLQGEMWGTTQETSATPNSRRLKAQIQFIQDEIAKLRKEAAETSQKTSVVKNPKYIAYEQKIFEAQLDVLVLEKAIPIYDSQIAQARQDLEAMRKKHEAGQVIQNRVRRAEEELQRLANLVKTVEVDQEMNARGLTSLRCVNAPEMPISKEGPVRGKVVLGGLVGGFLLTMVFLLARARLGKRLVRARDVVFSLGRTDVVGIPLLEPRNVRRYEIGRRRGWD